MQVMYSNTKLVKGLKWKLPKFGLDANNSFDLGDQVSTKDGSILRHHSIPVPFPSQDQLARSQKLDAEPTTPTIEEQVFQDLSPMGAVDPEHASGSPCSHTEMANQLATVSSMTQTAPQSICDQSGSHSLFNIFAILRQGPQSRSASTNTSVFLSPTDVEAATGMAQTRGNIQMHAGQLFIYPLVYILVWAIPFVTEILAHRRGNVPFELVLACLVSLCIQGAVDALVFSLREKPWRQLQGDESKSRLKFWNLEATSSRSPNVGRTREETLRHSKIARRCLNEGIEQRRLRRDENRSALEWWDSEHATEVLLADMAAGSC